MSEGDTVLSNDELMHIALHANREGRNQETIEALKQILARDTEDSKALYMLAAVHAEIGMIDDAVDEMARAVELDPGLTTAHFQLGLLHYMAGRYEEAAVAWQALAPSGEFECLYLFKTGLLALADGEYDDGIASLESGIAANQFNEPLNDDMRGILDGFRARLQDLDVAGAKNEAEAAESVAKRAVRTSDLSVYDQDDADS